VFCFFFFFLLWVWGDMTPVPYFLMWKDKVRAVRHGWRISENTFFLLSLLGGFIGVYCGMKRFRHKTKHFSFKFVVILSAFIWLILMPYWYFFLE